MRCSRSRWSCRSWCELLDRYGLRPAATEDVTKEQTSQQTGEPATPASTPMPVPISKPVDLDQLRTIVGDDREFMNELCETFVSSSARIVEELTRALSAGDRAVLECNGTQAEGRQLQHLRARACAARRLARKRCEGETLARARAFREHLAPRVRSARAGYVTAAMALKRMTQAERNFGSCWSKTSRPSA